MSHYETHKLQDLKIPMICQEGLFTEEGPSDPGNWHENVELIYVTEGAGTIINHDQRLSVQKGDVVVINTNCLHAFSTTKTLRYYYFIIDGQVSYYSDETGAEYKTGTLEDEKDAL